MYTCKVCLEIVRSSGGTGNLGKHLQLHHPAAHQLIGGHEPNKRALLTDLISLADAERRRQPSIEKWAVRKSKAPAVIATEARWVLWLTMSGVAFNAVSNPLFHWARRVHSN
jgi:hypothetical protein